MRCRDYAHTVCSAAKSVSLTRQFSWISRPTVKVFILFVWLCRQSRLFVQLYSLYQRFRRLVQLAAVCMAICMVCLPVNNIYLFRYLDQSVRLSTCLTYLFQYLDKSAWLSRHLSGYLDCISSYLQCLFGSSNNNYVRIYTQVHTHKKFKAKISKFLQNNKKYCFLVGEHICRPSRDPTRN